MRWYEVESSIKEERTLWFSHVTEDQLFMQNPLTYRAAWARVDKFLCRLWLVADERPAQDFRFRVYWWEKRGPNVKQHTGTSTWRNEEAFTKFAEL